MSVGWFPRGLAAETVVVYSALDREFSEPVLKAYAKQSRRRGPAQVRRREHQDGRPDQPDHRRGRRGRGATCSGTTRSSTRFGSRRRACSRRSSPSHAGDLPDDVQGQGRDLVRLRGPRPHPDRQHQARRRGRPAQGDQGPARPEVEGEDRHRQAALRHDGHARRLPVRRLGRREGQGVLPRPEGQRRAGPLGQQAGRHGRRLGPDRLRPDRHRRRDGRDRRRQPGRRSSTPTASPTSSARCSSPTRWPSSRARRTRRRPRPWPITCSAPRSRRRWPTARAPRSRCSRAPRSRRGSRRPRPSTRWRSTSRRRRSSGTRSPRSSPPSSREIECVAQSPGGYAPSSRRRRLPAMTIDCGGRGR